MAHSVLALITSLNVAFVAIGLQVGFHPLSVAGNAAAATFCGLITIRVGRSER